MKKVTSTNNSRLFAAPGELDVGDRDSLDIEVAKKIASTICCLAGAWTKIERTDKAKELLSFWQSFCDPKVTKDKKKILAILFLEGDFFQDGPKSRSKKMMMKRLQDSINTKLEWLNCQVMVVDSNTYNRRLFKVG